MTAVSDNTDLILFFFQLYSGPERVFEVRKGITPATFFYFRVKVCT